MAKNAPEANPFSFKNFVSGGPPGDLFSDEEEEKPFPDASAVKVKSKVKSKKPSAKASKTAISVAPVVDLFADESDLLEPAANDAPRAQGAVNKGAKKNDDSNPFSFTSFVKKDPAPTTTAKTSLHPDSSDDEWENSASDLTAAAVVSSHAVASVGLPSSTGALTTSDESDDDNDDDDDVSSLAHSAHLPAAVPQRDGKHTEKLLQQLSKLKEENLRLVAQLKTVEESAEAEKKRCRKLKKQLEVQQKRETEETAALERAVQMVEKNLETSTIRAVTAEKKVEKLKQQLLATQGSSAAQDQASLLHAQQLAAIREKGQLASLKLVTAAQNAEKSLRDLFGGVETLQFVAEVLKSIDKFAEAPLAAD